ncbi:MAG: TM1266 family iron-only hydrogenase system putative regulator [Syntrophomonadales bacterium]|jgi:putative iron-only hydrogenase system regulator
MANRLGVIGVVIEEMEVVSRVNQILSDHSRIIVGRMGIPYRQRGVSVISLIIDGSTDEIGSLTGKLGALKGVSVKSALTTK